MVLVGGAIFVWGYHERPLRYTEACYSVFQLVFMESSLAFPEEWYLQPLFFLIPIVGLGTMADSLVRLAYLVFTQKRNLPEWQRMVASLYHDHIVVVGVGKVGIRIVKGLVQLKEPVVAIESRQASPFLDEVHDLGVPVISGDGRQQKILEQANVARARAIILATDDDLANLDSALTARDINPQIQVVVRLFDDTLAVKVAGMFGMPAISTSQVSAPAFIAAATGRKVYHDFVLGGQHLHMVDLTIHEGSSLAGSTVGELQEKNGVNVAMHRGPAGIKINPAHEVTLCAHDTVLVLAPMEGLLSLERANQPG
jgi:Trk K+ transport system NAD-binding subunit